MKTDIPLPDEICKGGASARYFVVVVVDDDDDDDVLTKIYKDKIEWVDTYIYIYI